MSAPKQRREARPPAGLCVFEAVSWRCAGRRTLLGGLQGAGREKLALIESWSKAPRVARVGGLRRSAPRKSVARVGRLRRFKPKRTRR